MLRHELAESLHQRVGEILTGPAGKGGDVEVWMPSFPPLKPGP
ncbi:MAG: hypothetical protein ABIR80_13850 [Opitutaceae bacterium]